MLQAIIRRICTIAILGCLSPALAQAEAPIKIGLAISETGPSSPPSLFELRGYELAIQEINQAGGILHRPLELVKYDDQGNPSTAAQLYQKLLTSDRVDLMLSPYSADLTAAVAPIVNRAGRVMLTVTSASDSYDGRYSYIVQGITPAARIMLPLLDLAKSKGYKTLSILSLNNRLGAEASKALTAEAEAAGMKVLFHETYSPITTDFSALALKAGEPKPDMILGTTYLADSQGILRALKAQNVTAKMIGFSIGPIEPEFYKGLGGVAEDIFVPTSYFPTLKTNGNEEFVKNFRAKYDLDPTYHAAVAYAAVKTYAAAIERVGKIDQDAINKALHDIELDTVVGHFKVNANGAQIGYSAYLLQWQKGKQVLVWPAAEADADPILPHPGWQ
ncbi:amino acid ABC transporter substrate-binding protein [Bradyrhizobium sp. dw_78]|uniref:amino acid ABC transporter substrate-binding protein n=1 Tax=Bradyrhizobium sp. dw_78 TaxID=2719793 RepID=UPI001BD5F584|nr:amino acid ABC transporter substrate-binding protein [Bradyrhizobium sp. dw_78]